MRCIPSWGCCGRIHLQTKLDYRGKEARQILFNFVDHRCLTKCFLEKTSTCTNNGCNDKNAKIRPVPYLMPVKWTREFYFYYFGYCLPHRLAECHDHKDRTCSSGTPRCAHDKPATSRRTEVRATPAANGYSRGRKFKALLVFYATNGLGITCRTPLPRIDLQGLSNQQEKGTSRYQTWTLFH